MRAAVIGCGRMGAFPSEAVRRFAPPCWFPLSHAEAIERHPQLELSALCDREPQALERAAARYPVSRTFTDYRRMLQEVRPQLLGIATRTVGRAAIIQDAAQHGVQALHIEKPLCNSVAELGVLAGMFGRRDLFCTYGTIRRHFAIYETALALARSGRYGALREVRVNMGSGALYWTHPHSVDLILLAAGESKVEAVQARLADVVHGGSQLEITSDPVIESASIYFEGGLAGHITLAPGCDLVLSCSEGEVVVESDGRGIRVAARSGEDPYLVRTPCVQEGAATAEGTLAPISHLVDCLSGDAVQQGLNQGLKAHIILGQTVLFALLQSHLENSRLVSPAHVNPAITIWGRTGDSYA